MGRKGNVMSSTVCKRRNTRFQLVDGTSTRRSLDKKMEFKSLPFTKIFTMKCFILIKRKNGKERRKTLTLIYIYIFHYESFFNGNKNQRKTKLSRVKKTIFDIFF